MEGVAGRSTAGKKTEIHLVDTHASPGHLWHSCPEQGRGGSVHVLPDGDLGR